MDNIGDIVILTPALRALRKAFPDASITLLTSPAGSQLRPLLPWLDDMIVWRAIWQDVSSAQPFDPLREQRLIQLLRDGCYDAAFIFTSFTQSPYPPAYACYLAGIPIRVGFSREFGGGILSHWGRPPMDNGHQVDRNLALLGMAGVAADGVEMDLRIPTAVKHDVDVLLAQAGLPPGSPFVGVAPGASCAARRYPLDRFSMVIDALGHETHLPILILGSRREQDGFRPLEPLIRPGQVISLVGKTSVPELVEIIRRAELAIANNSAALHIADVFHTPQVILYSGTEYRSQWMPRFSPAVLLKRETHCSPCYRFDCPYNLECLDIPPAEVVQAAVDLIGRHRRSAQADPLLVEEMTGLPVDEKGSTIEGNAYTKKRHT
jgi:ADP-heptose:LPS heptosyltransferase